VWRIYIASYGKRSWMMSWCGFARRRNWPVWRDYVGIAFRGWGKQRKTLVRIACWRHSSRVNCLQPFLCTGLGRARRPFIRVDSYCTHFRPATRVSAIFWTGAVISSHAASLRIWHSNTCALGLPRRQWPASQNGVVYSCYDDISIWTFRWWFLFKGAFLSYSFIRLKATKM
jgi:hypothetical protein